jgi:hypothetical protein
MNQVEDLREEELRLNDRIAALRKTLEDPAVAQEAEAKRRSGEASRLLLARWQKLRKKGKTVLKAR